jgi:NAD(P)-dependent dehydrogenase (short-subunit alcohol dehydrogenase family)
MTRSEPALVVITGAGSGIGRATARRFANRGDTVIVTDINKERAAETVELIGTRAGSAHAHHLDVTDAQAWADLGAEIRRAHGVPNVLVNNAGYTTAGRFVDQTAADWEDMLAVNVMGTVQGARVFAAQMIDEAVHGSIVNVASAAAYTPVPAASAYCATKAAVWMASECLRAELAPHKIGVTAICPGFINTSFYADAHHLGADTAKIEQFRTASISAARKAAHDPDTVAKAIVRSVQTNPAIQPVTVEAKLGYALSRLSPGLLRFSSRLAKFDGLTSLAQLVSGGAR